MKIVKVCPECKKYNNYKLYECAFCGANLSDDTLQVNDDEMELKPIIKEKKEEPLKVEEKISNEIKKDETKNNVIVRICPMCGSEEDELWCKNCGMFLEDAEISVSSEKKEVKELKFSLAINGKHFEYVASEEVKYIGRHDFDRLNDEDLISVSRTHLEYYLKDSKLYFKDISSYGSYLNNERMEKGKEYIINDKDIIKLVYFEMEINY